MNAFFPLDADDETWRRSKNSASTLKLMRELYFRGKKFFFSTTQRKSRDVEYINAKHRLMKEERLYSSFVSFFRDVSSSSSSSSWLWFKRAREETSRCKYIPRQSVSTCSLIIIIININLQLRKRSSSFCRTLCVPSTSSYLINPFRIRDKRFSSVFFLGNRKGENSRFV